jgi:hypothetical protein
MVADIPQAGPEPQDHPAARRKRMVMAGALILLGAGAIVYAAAFHFIPVQTEAPKAADSQQPEVAAPGPGTETLSPAASPGAEAAQVRAILEPEPALVKEVSVGGVTLTPSGAIKRTYSAQAPSQCPT